MLEPDIKKRIEKQTNEKLVFLWTTHCVTLQRVE